MDTAVGPSRAIQSSRASATASRRSSGLRPGGVRTILTSTSRARRRGSMSTQASPQRVSPGSIPRTRCWATTAREEAGTARTGRNGGRGGAAQSSSASSPAATSALMSTEV